jgi:hypothetical protein
MTNSTDITLTRNDYHYVTDCSGSADASATFAYPTYCEVDPMYPAASIKYELLADTDLTKILPTNGLVFR